MRKDSRAFKPLVAEHKIASDFCSQVHFSHLHNSWRICRLWRGWRLLLDVTASPDLRLDATDSFQRLLPSLLSLLHSGKRLQDGLHLPLLSCLQRDRRVRRWEESAGT